MKKSSGFDRFIAVSILLAILVNIASNYYSGMNPAVIGVIGKTIVAILMIWAFRVVVIKVLEEFTAGRMAVEALILAPDDKLLLYRHPYHDNFIPPGGRISPKELPEDGLQRALKERVGLNETDFSFHPIIHNRNRHKVGHLGKVERVVTPFIIQKELKQQRLLKRFHYDFIYVLQLDDTIMQFPDNEYRPFKFVDLKELEEIERKKDTFPDVVDAYKRVLFILDNERD